MVLPNTLHGPQLTHDLRIGFSEDAPKPAAADLIFLLLLPVRFDVEPVLVYSASKGCIYTSLPSRRARLVTVSMKRYTPLRRDPLTICYHQNGRGQSSIQ